MVHDLPNFIFHIDELLLHCSLHQEHLEHLDLLLQCLVQQGIEIYLLKCKLGSTKDVSYSALPKSEFFQGTDNLKAIRDLLPPSTVQEFCQFLGLCHFFHIHIRDYAQITSALNALVNNEWHCKGGPLPAKGMQAFQERHSYLCSDLIVDYPQKDQPFNLIMDASLSNGKKPGRVGAILTQTNRQGHHALSLVLARNSKDPKRTMPQSSWKCSSPYGGWSTSPPIYKANPLPCSPSIDLLRSLDKPTPRRSIGYKRPCRSLTPK